MTYSDAIIKRLTDLCVERGITTNKLATLSGITQSTLNSMMRGETKNPKYSCCISDRHSYCDDNNQFP